MAKKELDEQLQSLSPSLPLLFLRSKDDDKISFCSFAKIGNPVSSLKIPDELCGKEITNCYHDWFVLVDEDKQYSLLNPLTLEYITLPHLDLTPEQEVNDNILTSSPGLDNNSSLILFEKNGPSLICCKIGHEEWTHHHIEEDFMQGRYLVCPAMCNGMLYALTNGSHDELIQIDPNNFNLQLVEFEASENSYEPIGSLWRAINLIESAGDLYLIILYFSRTQLESIHQEVIDVEISFFDLSKMKVKAVESFKDRAFFITCNSSFCCLADGLKIKGNHIYFTFGCDKCVYSLNMDGKSVSITLLHPAFQNLMHNPTWIKSNSRNVDRQNEDQGDLYYGNEKKFDDSRLVRHSSIRDDVKGDFGKLRRDILFEIGKRLILGDYISFRSCNKECWIACTREAFENYARSIPPWLTYLQYGEETYHCLDILHDEQHFIKLPDNSLKNSTMCHSSSGWCVMLHEEDSIFLWNPFSHKIILLPDLTYGCEYVVDCTLSRSIDTVIIVYQYHQVRNIDLLSLVGGEWSTWTFDLIDFEAGRDNNVVYYNKHICLFDTNGNLGCFSWLVVDEEARLQLVYRVATPCSSSFDQSFLTEYDEKLVSVFVGSMGEWIRIFTLDSVEQAWVEIENLGNKTLYVSRFSYFSAVAPILEMRNKVYLSRFCCDDSKVLCYCLSSKKLHTHGTRKSLESFDNTKNQLLSGWIEVKWW